MKFSILDPNIADGTNQEIKIHMLEEEIKSLKNQLCSWEDNVYDDHWDGDMSNNDRIHEIYHLCCGEGYIAESILNKDATANRIEFFIEIRCIHAFIMSHPRLIRWARRIDNIINKIDHWFNTKVIYV